MKPKPRYEWRTQNDGREKEFSDLAIVEQGGPSLTIQSMKDDNDPNVIVQRFMVTGQMPNNGKTPLWGDFSQPMDYRTALDAIRTAQQSFDQLDPQLRKRFSNDPAELLEWVEKPENALEAAKLGLIPNAAVPQPAEQAVPAEKVVPSTT